MTTEYERVENSFISVKYNVNLKPNISFIMLHTPLKNLYVIELN